MSGARYADRNEENPVAIGRANVGRRERVVAGHKNVPYMRHRPRHGCRQERRERGPVAPKTNVVGDAETGW